MGEIVQLNCSTTLDISPDRVVRSAAEQNFERVMVVGVNEKGELYLASSQGSLADSAALLAIAQLRLTRMMDAALI